MVRVRVPATTANLGPGFDSVGMALSLYNTFEIYESDEKPDFDEDNLIYKASKYIYEKKNIDYQNLRIRVEGDVPRSRGLGSSATCIIGGLVGANELLGRPFSTDDILNFATEIEGHPDNVAPALLGSCIFSIMKGDRVIYHRLSGLNEIQSYAAIPEFPLETALARSVLPEKVPFVDAINNLSRMPFLLEGLRTSNLDMILEGTIDRLHEPYRKELIHGYEIMKDIEKRVKGRMLISGAGPTLLFITDRTRPSSEVIDEWYEIAKKTGYIWNILELDIDETGAQIL